MRSAVFSFFVNSARARSSAGCTNFISRSCKVTSKPRNAHHAAISPPITPAPTTCTCWIACSAPLPSALRRSCRKNTRIRLRAVDVCASFATARASSLRRCGDVRTTAAPDFDQRERRGILIRARLRRGLLAQDRRQNLPCRPDVRCPRDRALDEGARRGWPIISLAVSSSSSGEVRRSTSPIAFAFSADAARPVSISSSAAGAPIRRGKRAVPPQPGRMPSLTSGNPMRVDGSREATR